MADAQYHPAHVDRALARIDAIVDEDGLLAAVGVVHGPDAVPPEVHVRLLRRCRVEANRRLEGAVLRALVKRVGHWVARNYVGLSPADREDMSQELLAHVAKAVARTTGIDWWECRFFFNLRNAAADQYEKMFDEGLRSATADISEQAEYLHDKGALAKKLVEDAVRRARLAEILDPDELALVHPLFLSTLPLSSQKAKLDLVRYLGIPAGTLAEKKAAIIEKLKAALEKESLS